MSPRYLRTPSNPSDSIRTLSPTSNDFALARGATYPPSDCRLAARLEERVDVIGVLAGALEFILRTDELDATDEGLPTTDRRPDGAATEADFGDKEIEDVDRAVLSL